MAAETTAAIQARRVLKDYFKTISAYDFGNNQLYDLCRAHGLHAQENEILGATLTKQEAAFADQMWLIGRAYAASPQRYNYGKNRKPSERYLPDEGYESFFNDISRILLRWPSKRNGNEIPTIYLRGKEVNLNEPDQAIAGLPMFSYNDAETCPNVAHACAILFGDGQASSPGIHSFLQKLEYLKSGKRQSDAAGSPTSYDLQSPQYDNGKDGAISVELAPLTATDNNVELLLNTSNLVIQFAELIQAARLLRDAAILKCSSREQSRNRFLERKTSRIGARKGGARETACECTKRERVEAWRSDISQWRKTIRSGNQSLNISFSSKFLHFQCPRAFFIYDSISAHNTRSEKDNHISIAITTSAETSTIFNLKRPLPSDTCPYQKQTVARTYFFHAAIELVIACAIHNSLGDCETHNRSITRMADILITNATKVTKP